MRRSQRYFLIEIALIVLFATAFCVFVIVWEDHLQQKESADLQRHAQVVENDLWKLDAEGPLVYLELAARLHNYKSLTVYDGISKPFVQVVGPDPSPMDQILIKSGLISHDLLQADIIYQGEHIGSMEAVHRHEQVYLYLYLLLVLVLVLLGTRFFLRSLEQTRERAKAEEQYRLLFERTGTAMAVIEADGSLSLVNRTFTQLAETDESNIIGQQFLAGVAETDKQRMQEYHQMRLRGEHAPDSYEFRFRSSNNNEGYALANLTFLPDSGKTLASIINITERKQAEQALSRYQQELERLVDERTRDLAVAKEDAESASRVKGNFLTNITHELRTPLNAILGFSEMLLNDSHLRNDLKEKIGIINRSGKRLLSMINQVLDLTKIDSGQLASEEKPCDLSAMLRDLGKEILLRAEAAQLEFTQELDPGLPHFIHTDCDKLRQILFNLLDNAVKFTREGSVTLRVCSEPFAHTPSRVNLLLVVEDTGQGLDPEQLENICKPFVQERQALIGQDGMGIGLTITQSYVELLDGKMTVESTPGQGSLFRLVLPVTLAEPLRSGDLEDAHSEVLEVEPDQPQWRILVVEDNPDNRLLLGGLLQQAGFKIHQTENGEQAVEVFRVWQPHLIWMNMHMPVLDGFQTTARIRGMPGGDTVKIIALTTRAFAHEREAILQAGCDDVLYKPLQSHAVFEIMAQQLGVQYLYKQALAQQEPESNQVITSEMLNKLPQAQRDSLAVAVERLDMEAMVELIRDIDGVDPEIATGLQALVDNYSYDRILKLLTEANSQDEQ